MTTTDSRDTTADARPHSTEFDASLDATFDALATRRCRDLLRHLADRDDDRVAVDALAARLAGDDADATRLRTSLHHTHLPKLDDAGLVDYDADRGEVRYRSDSAFEAMAPAVTDYEPADHPVSLDGLFDLLADARRRAALQTLLTHDDLSLPDLADEVAVAERGRPLPRVDPDAVLDVYLSLYHTHVPKLAATGLVAYDQEDDFVALTDAGRELASPIRTLCDAPTE